MDKSDDILHSDTLKFWFIFFASGDFQEILDEDIFMAGPGTVQAAVAFLSPGIYLFNLTRPHVNITVQGQDQRCLNYNLIIRVVSNVVLIF